MIKRYNKSWSLSESPGDMQPLSGRLCNRLFGCGIVAVPFKKISLKNLSTATYNTDIKVPAVKSTSPARLCLLNRSPKKIRAKTIVSTMLNLSTGTTWAALPD